MAAGINRQVTAITAAVATTVLTAPSSADFKRVAKGMFQIRNKGGSDTLITIQTVVTSPSATIEHREFTLPAGGDWVNGDREWILTDRDWETTV